MEAINNNQVSPTSGFNPLDRILNITGALAAIAATLWGIWVKVQVDTQTLAIDNIKASIAQSADSREQREHELNLTMKVFEEIKDIFEDEKQLSEVKVNRLSAVAALVLAVPNIEIRERLGQSVNAALSSYTIGDSESAQKARHLKEDFESALFFESSINVNNEQSRIPTIQEIEFTSKETTPENPKWGALNFNLFWCDGAQNSQSLRETAENALKLRGLDPDASGVWRVKKLPSSVNLSQGYNISKNVIRASSNQEAVIGKTLADVLDRHGMPNFSVQQVNYTSPFSISIFFCGH